METETTLQEEVIVIAPSVDEETESYKTEISDESENMKEITETQVTIEEEETITEEQEQQEVIETNTEPLQQITTTEIETIDYSAQLETIILQQQEINTKLQNINNISEHIFGIGFIIMGFWLIHKFIIKPFFGSI